VLRCRRLADWAQALGLQLGPGAQGQQTFQGRVQQLQGLLLAEEVYPSRLSLAWGDPAARPALLLVQHGRCIVEGSGAAAPLLMLRADGRNAALLSGAGSQRLTVTQAPCRLLRLVLPEAALHPPPGAWSVDLGLLLPMLRLLEQSLQRAAPAHTRLELADTLLAYIWDRLAAAGCVVQMPPAQAEPADGDPVAQLERWLPEHLGQPLELADLAAAVNLSPRRLQELCRQRHGCSPMDLLRQQRLALLAKQLHHPARSGTSLAALMAALQLSDSASTRQAFERTYGCSPAAYRRRGAMAAQPA
jgi:AraC-like DNA-binding protein